MEEVKRIKNDEDPNPTSLYEAQTQRGPTQTVWIVSTL